MRVLSDIASRAGLAARAGQSFGGARDLYNALGYKRDLESADFRARFRRNAVARRIVTALPDATWRGQGELVEDEDPNIDTAFEIAWEELTQRVQVWPILRRADILAGLGRYAVILIGAPGALAEELPQMGGPDGVAYLSPFAETEVQVDKLVDNREDKRFALPQTYKFIRLSGNKTIDEIVHWTRVIHVAEGLLDDHVYGEPRLECVWNLLDDLEKVTGGGSEAFWLRAHQGFVASIDPDVKVDAKDIADLKEQAEEFAHQIRRSIAARGVDYKSLGSDVAPIDNHADAVLSQIAAGSRIPKRILMGSERGELASSQDQENWDDQVSDRREQFASPQMVRPLVDRLISYGALPAPVEYAVRWPEMRNLDDAGRAEIAERWASVNFKNGETVVTADEIRDRVLGLPPLDTLEDGPDVPVVATRFSDVDQAASEPAWRAIHRAADKHRTRLRDEVSAAFARATRSVPFAELLALVQDDDTDRAAVLLATAAEDAMATLVKPLTARLFQTLVDGANGSARSARKDGLRQPRGAANAIDFDQTNPAAVRWAEERSAELITGINAETRLAIRAAMSDAFTEGIPPRQLAIILRQLVGLTQIQARAVLNVRSLLAEANPGALVKAGKVSIRVPKGGVTQALLQRVATDYAKRLLSQRAMMIARTETIAASNEGQRQLWLQAAQTGLLTGVEQREWIITPDDRLCPDCEEMDGQLRGLEEPFVGPGGESVMGPPLHPMCRCTTGISAQERRDHSEQPDADLEQVPA